MIFWCGSASAASYEGKVDGGSGSTINGWAWDASAPDSPVDVTLSVIKVSDQSVAFTNTFTADQYRQDLENCGKGNGKHSFAITVDWSSLEDTEYQIRHCRWNTAVWLPLLSVRDLQSDAFLHFQPHIQWTGHLSGFF